MLPIPSSDKLWQTHEKLVLNIFIRALVELRNKEHLPEDEPTLNELLYVAVKRIHHDLRVTEKPIWALVRNSPNPIQTEEDIEESWSEKKPDFTWNLHNQTETDYTKAHREYTIECKRLGEKTQSGWDLIGEYVKSGIIRYITQEHSYGIGAPSGAMIGYLQNMDFGEIITKINDKIQNAKKHKIPKIQFGKRKKNQKNIHQGSHVLNRKGVKPNIFQLIHLWIDFNRN